MATPLDIRQLEGRIAFVTASATEEVADIMVLELGEPGEPQPRAITRSEPGHVFLRPSWSPDGARIAYQDSVPAQNQVGIWVMDADGSNPELVAARGAAGAWSPDGTELVISNLEPGKRGLALVSVDHADQPRRYLTTVSEAVPEEYPAWSPDGLRVAFNSHREGASSDIWVVSRDGNDLANLTHDPSIDEGPNWSPDGMRIAFSSNRTGNGDVYLMDPDGANLVRLTDGSDYEGGPVWSPDGRFIIFTSRRGGSLGIWVMRTDGTGASLLVDTPAEELMVSWTP